jgi:putative membrane protein
VRSVQMLLKFALRVVVLAVIFYAVTELVSGIRIIGNAEAPLGITGSYLWIALVFALVNSIMGPVLRLLSIPFVIVTLGLFLLVINALLLGITAVLSDRLEVDGVLSAVVGGFLIAVFSWIAELVLPLKVRAG